MRVLFIVLVVWTLVIAVGSFFPPSSETAQVKPAKETASVDGVRTRKQPTADFRRPVIVGLTMGTFLTVWALALKSKSNKR